MPRFRYDNLAACTAGDTIELDRSEASHLFKILRARPGDVVGLLDGKPCLSIKSHSEVLGVRNNLSVVPAGLGDMAVSNTIGSNVFDILVGLGIPWGLQTMVVNYGSTVSSSHFLSEVTLDTCASQGASVALALQLRASGEALPPSPLQAGSRFVQRHPEQPGGACKRQPMFAWNSQVFRL